jgi:hypothetical protein
MRVAFFFMGYGLWAIRKVEDVSGAGGLTTFTGPIPPYARDDARELSAASIQEI